MGSLGPSADYGRRGHDTAKLELTLVGDVGAVASDGRHVKYAFRIQISEPHAHGWTELHGFQLRYSAVAKLHSRLFGLGGPLASSGYAVATFPPAYHLRNMVADLPNRRQRARELKRYLSAVLMYDGGVWSDRESCEILSAGVDTASVIAACIQKHASATVNTPLAREPADLEHISVLGESGQQSLGTVRRCQRPEWVGGWWVADTVRSENWEPVLLAMEFGWLGALPPASAHKVIMPAPAETAGWVRAQDASEHEPRR